MGDRTRLNANLIPFNKMDEKRKKEIQSMGGKKVQEINAKKRLLKEYLELALAIEDEEGTDKYTKIVKALINEAEDGNVKAFETIRDTIGQKPVDKVDMSANVSYEQTIKEVVDTDEY